ncbi:ClC family H(+)/Cl(-) exchange transporter [Candidatus Formimonas warabiya]|uniref:ClC family H(+)/Cl(-) exchange transporter n=1 Tax=Formimonas warabiya TaxID=1761012 RepID=A0A3G1KSV8_FORW1|nr:ClC family H(+)/Cl(-) exchange transporter [Candidatus Formimonas warabiya]ATW25510.1 ClC family H(+)/Cl(-) exchange transporter [Candidatus Formimonas warabiya]
MTSQTYKTLNQWWDFRLKLYGEGIFTGLLTSFVIVCFRFSLEKAELFRTKVFLFAQTKNHGVLVLWFIALILIGFLLGKLTQWEPLASGSGIPQVKGVLLGKIKTNWLSVLIVKFWGGLLAIGAGLSLGREGPSVQIGAAVGQGMSRLLGRLRIEERYLITCGASAGLATAFNAPLAGVIFALEELHKNFSPLVLTSAMVSSLTADFISQQFFGQKPIFSFHNLPVLPLNYYLYLIVLGLMMGAFGVFFNYSLIKISNLYKKIKYLPKTLIPLIPLAFAGILGLVLPEVLGGGHKIIESLIQNIFSFKVLLLLLAVKFLFTMASYGSGVPGGIFLPLLVIGALAGKIYGIAITHYLSADPMFLNNFIVLAMAAYFTAIVKAPVTGSILITEMTGSFNHLLPLITVSMTAYFVCDLLKSEPIYETLLGRLLPAKGKLDSASEKGNKVLLEIAVSLGSKVAGKKIRDLIWPYHCLIVGIKRGNSEIIPTGDTVLFPGDYLIVLSNQDKMPEVRESLTKMCSECSKFLNESDSSNP